MKKYKKNYAKYLPKIGSTAVVALAMSVALAAPANASELSEGDTPPMENPPADTDLTSTPTNAGELVETNGAIAQENQDTLDDNEDILDSNETTLNENENWSKPTMPLRRKTRIRWMITRIFWTAMKPP